MNVKHTIVFPVVLSYATHVINLLTYDPRLLKGLGFIITAQCSVEFFKQLSLYLKTLASPRSSNSDFRFRANSRKIYNIFPVDVAQFGAIFYNKSDTLNVKQGLYWRFCCDLLTGYHRTFCSVASCLNILDFPEMWSNGLMQQNRSGSFLVLVYTVAAEVQPGSRRSIHVNTDTNWPKSHQNHSRNTVEVHPELFRTRRKSRHF